MTKINDFKNSFVAYLVCNPFNGLKLSFEIPQNNWFKSQEGVFNLLKENGD